MNDAKYSSGVWSADKVVPTAIICMAMLLVVGGVVSGVYFSTSGTDATDSDGLVETPIRLLVDNDLATECPIANVLAVAGGTWSGFRVRVEWATQQVRVDDAPASGFDAVMWCDTEDTALVWRIDHIPGTRLALAFVADPQADGIPSRSVSAYEFGLES